MSNQTRANDRARRLVCTRCFCKYNFNQLAKDIDKAANCLKKSSNIGNYVILGTRCSSARASKSLSLSLSSPSSFTHETYFKDKGNSAVQ